jgi:hypothetical protein
MIAAMSVQPGGLVKSPALEIRLPVQRSCCLSTGLYFCVQQINHMALYNRISAIASITAEDADYRCSFWGSETCRCT